MLEPVWSMASPLWALTNSAARACFKGRARRLKCPVVSIGNIVAGGVGKTEVTALIAARLVGEGRRVVVASRGYGSRWEREGGVAFDAETALARRFPDEALVLLRKVPGVAVAVGADRFGVLTKHWGELRPDVVLLDDGFQHFKLERELDIVVHDFSLRWPVWRDLPSALRQARVRVALSDVPGTAVGHPWVQACYRVGAVCASDKQSDLPKEARAFCGIGNPERFRKTLEQAGVKVTGFKVFPDHVNYTEQKIQELKTWANPNPQNQSSPLLTTLKDYVKLEPWVKSQGKASGFDPRWVLIKLEITKNEPLFWEPLYEALSGKNRGVGEI